MRIISIKQPWASLIITGAPNVETGEIELKDIENRTWATSYRGPLLIHSSGRRDAIGPDEIDRRFNVRSERLGPVGGVVGVVDLVDCVTTHPSKWYVTGHYGFVLANPRPLRFTPWRGALSIRKASDELMALCGLTRSMPRASDASHASSVRDRAKQVPYSKA
jgi:hypothetical protein